jgi:DNA-binding beta-propeller fold protein YncE
MRHSPPGAGEMFMRRLVGTRKFLTGTACAAVVAGLAAAPFVLDRGGAAHAQGAPAAGDVMVPKFEVDPFWPKPLPNHWVLAMTIGLSMDAKDNVWIVHRPQTLEQKESYSTRGEADCCTAAPDVLEFDPAGNLLHHWGRDEVKGNGHDWPSSNHGITVGPDGNIWLGGNGAYQPGAAPGSAAQFAAPAGAPASPQMVAREGGGEIGIYHDSFILKFTPEGKYLGQIGKANGSKGSLDTDNVRGVAQIRFMPNNEMVLADGYGNKRISVWDATTMKFKRMWGAYGKKPNDDPIPHYDVNSPQFGNPVHCAQPSNDGLIYVCDRTNNRIQVFKTDGTYVQQYVVKPGTKGDGSVWEIAFSRDPQQKFMYISDGANENIHVFDRKTMKELYWFGGGGRQPGQFYAVHSIVTDSKGNIYTTETYRGQRVQKFIYKGMVPLSSLLKQGVVGGSRINP